MVLISSSIILFSHNISSYSHCFCCCLFTSCCCIAKPYSVFLSILSCSCLSLSSLSLYDASARALFARFSSAYFVSKISYVVINFTIRHYYVSFNFHITMDTINIIVLRDLPRFYFETPDITVLLQAPWSRVI